MPTFPRLARYEVLGRLAAGGMAEVWLARALGVGGFEKLVVLKTILSNLAQNTSFVQMFVNEARLAAMLSHPNCVQIFDLGEEGGTLYIAMEYIEGFALSRVLKRAKEHKLVLPVEVVARIIIDAASGLDYAHRLTDREGKPLDLVHRDVSPDNLLVSFSGQTKLVDFGVAKAATTAAFAATAVGVVKGKLGYIAPEYLRGEQIDGRADLFALGVVLYRALTGRRPFLGPNEAAISRAVLYDPPRPPLELMPTLSPALAGVVLLALEKQPSARFESARVMRDALEAAVGKPATTEAVGDYMNALWPPGDPERVALHALASGVSEETSSPVLQAIITGGYEVPIGAVSTPHRFSQVAQPTSTSVAAPAESSAELPHPIDVSLQRSRTYLVAAAIVFAAVAGGVIVKAASGPAAADAPPAKTLDPQKPADPPKPTVATGHLSVKTEPPVRVFEGKTDLGNSPLELDLAAGPHTLRLVNRPQAVDQTVVLTLKAGETTQLLELEKGTLVFKIVPWAYVKLDGRMLGQTPVGARQVFAGTHVVELSNTELNENRKFDVRVKGGETKTINVDFEAETE